MSNLFPCFFVISGVASFGFNLNQVWSMTLILISAFFYQKGHLGLTLIQLELLSLYVLYSIFFSSWGPCLQPISLFMLFCVLVAEAALGMSFLVVTSRQTRVELEKFSF